LIRRVLRNDQWERIAPELPGKPGDPGVTAKDNRLFVEAVWWIARTGAPWRDLPEEFGNWYTVYTRFWRWARKGVWERIFKTLPRGRVFYLVLSRHDRSLRQRKSIGFSPQISMIKSRAPPRRWLFEP
jgi:transposase